jgi:hypothetical protein
MVISCQFLVIMAQTGFSRPIWHPFAKKTAGAPPLVTHRDRFVSMCTRALWGPLMAGRLCFCRRNFKDAFPKNRARFYVHSKNRARFSYEKSGEPKISPEKSGETLPGIALCDWFCLFWVQPSAEDPFVHSCPAVCWRPFCLFVFCPAVCCICICVYVCVEHMPTTCGNKVVLIIVLIIVVTLCWSLFTLLILCW